MRYILFSTILLLISNLSFSQKAKNGDYTVAAAGVVLNAYTDVTANITAGATSLTVTSNTLTNGPVLTTPLAPGDLILIIQMQGASMDIDVHPVTSWGGNYTLSESTWNDFLAGNYSTVAAKRKEWGAVTNYNNSGKYEYAEVVSVSGSTGITVRCGLKNSYTASGHVQVVRVPRLGNLTLNANATVVPEAWGGVTGGIVALEVNGTVNFGTNSRIVASGFGFRGGVVDNVSNGPGNATDIGKPGYSDASEGGEKGEGIGGSATATGELTVTYYSRYGMGAAANGGGGGNYKNAGGGGGSNFGTGVYTGTGVLNPAYLAFYALESVTASSSGGGRGGYSGAQTDQNEATVGPNNASWSGDSRRVEGGLGGHPLAYDASRVFMGGGGGAGEMDNNQGGSGGAGGGIVFLQSYGSITGTGTIEANGANGQNSNPLNQTAGVGTKRGIDGAGGAGGGGAIIISNGTAIPATITLSAKGGNGGDNALNFGSFTSGVEADGPGGGGGGGFVNFTSGTPVVTTTGGNSGIVTIAGNLTTNIVAGFPPNGATNGAVGSHLTTQPYFNLIANNAAICSGNTASVSVTVQGTLPAPATNASINWYASYTSTTSLGTGLTFTTPALTTTTTYYVGLCPGTFRIPVTVSVGGPTIAGSAVVTDATCAAGGSITGLTTTGGVNPVTITWNGVVSPTMNLTNASAGTYSVVVTDDVGCEATSGPYTIATSGGPSISSTDISITHASCLGGGGAISGIVATGDDLTFSWNSGAYSTLDITGLNAGAYDLVVTDGDGCVATLGPINVGQATGPTIATAGMNVAATTCGLNNGSINGLAASGNNLTYNWNSGAYTSLDITGLASGNYTLVVTDNAGCTDTLGPITIGASSAPVIDTDTISIVAAHCGQSNGALTGLNVTGGQPGYNFSWNSGVYNTMNLSGIPAGSYSLVVTDDAGCTANVGPFVVNDVAGPTLNLANVQTTAETCAMNDGTISGLQASGTGLIYTWNGVVSPTLNQTNLPAGTYALAVIDQFGCIAIGGPFTVNPVTPMSLNTAALTITPTACVLHTGAISGLQVNGGINPVVSWSPGNQSTLDITDLAAGNYTITVTDDQNCSVQQTFTVPTVSGLSVNTDNAVVTNDFCAVGSGSISGVSIIGGTAPYSYSWNTMPQQSAINAVNLTTGTYTLTVTDGNGCLATATLFVGVVPPSEINQDNVIVTDESCAGNNGSISGVQVTGNAPFTYNWVGTSLTSLDLTNLQTGVYTLILTDGNGCVTNGTPITVGLDGMPQADFSISNQLASPGEVIHFSNTSTGGPFQSYSWTISGVGLVGTASSASFSSMVETTYEMTLIVETPDGCIDSITKPFEILGEIRIPNIITANGDHTNDEFYITNLKPNSRLLIQNRWGNVVFETDNYKNNWGGIDITGEKLPDGVYFYQLITADGKTWQGNVHLLID